MKLTRLKKLVFLHLAHLPMKSRGVRALFAKLGGVNILCPSKTFIGENVTFDTNFPEDITIEEGVRITVGCTLVTHFMEPQEGRYSRGKIHIKKGAYLGAHTIVCKPVTIGQGAVVGAGSVVTKDIPDYEVWAGNPAKFKKKIINNHD